VVNHSALQILLLRILIGQYLAQVTLKVTGILAKIVQQSDCGTGRPKPDLLGGPSRSPRNGLQVFPKKLRSAVGF
jgi:hypothetical protein